MIDVRLVRDDPDAVKAALARKGVDPAEVDEIARLDAEARAAGARRDEVRARVKALSVEVRDAHRAGDRDRAEALAAESRALGDEDRDLTGRADELAAALRDRLLVLPNLPAPDVPDGTGDSDNVVARGDEVDPAGFAEHQRVPHWDVGAELGILDLERGAKIAGSMFPMFRGAGATLARALCQWWLDSNADAYEEVRPPTLVLTSTMTATGHLPKFSVEAYAVERDDLWVIPTAEVPLTSIGRDEVFDEADLPLRLMAYTPCFRREAGAAGSDTRGLLRSHEFDKVELVTYSTADDAPKMHLDILERAERLLPPLGLPYRVLEICTGDLGLGHHRQYDVEVYAPGVGRWLEVSSVSWYTDYQARRANIRYRPAGGGAPRFVHTCNGSALAVPRVWAALVETHRQPDGSVAVPEVLRPYMRGAERITR